MKPKYSTTFIVEGSGFFPLDMLRYDDCRPLTSEDAAKTRTVSPQTHPHGDVVFHHNITQVALTKLHPRKDPALTLDRWRSFLWRIVPGTVRTERI